MSDQRNGPQGLAQQVADGEPTDWDEALRSTTDPDVRRIIESLRVLEDVAQVHRGGPAPGHVQGEALAAADTIAVPARRWGHLELREKLGEGGFGEVFRAWDPSLEREVALKLLHVPDRQASGAASRVVEEGRLLAKVRHPNVITVHGAEIRDDRVGLWMEFVRGRSLEQLLRDQGPFGARETALIGIDLCRALAAVHRAGVIHRDVKAQNVMREAGGRILLMDFGAGVDLRDRDAKGESVSGTPLYMAPELFRDQPATQRSDIYGLGVLLFHLVTGSFPVQAGTWEELCSRHGQREARLLRDERPDLPEGFVSVVERAMAWDPEQRFATAGQMEQALALAIGIGSGAPATHEAAPPPTPRAAGVRRWIHATLGLVLVVSVAVIVWRLVASSGGRQPAEPPNPPGTSRVSVTPSDAALPPSTGSGSVAEVPKGKATVTPVAGAGEPYTVEAGVYRVAAGSNQRDRLESGARLSLGDRLTLEFEASAPLYVYVINEDEAGHSYALFPLPGLDLQNPLPPGRTHVIPGARSGRNLSWAVDSPGGREHLLVLASPTRLVAFEADMNGLARPGQIAVPIPDAARIHLRGLGSLVESPPTERGKTAGPLFEMAQRLASRSEVTHGVWMRRMQLENPRP